MFNVYKYEGENLWYVSSHSQMIDAKNSVLNLDPAAYIEVGRTEDDEPIMELDTSKFEIFQELAVDLSRIKPPAPLTTAEIVMNRILSARSFGEKLISEIAAENVLLGITQANKTSDVRKASREVTDALATGSLYDAIAELRAIPVESRDPVFLSEARLLSTINKIETYLELPHSSEL